MSGFRRGLPALMIAIFFGLVHQPVEESMAQDAQTVSMRELVLSALEAYSADDFVEVDAFEDILNDAYFESRNWMTAVLGEINDPHAEANAATHSYHLWRGEQPGFDLLRHEYVLQSRSIVVTESVPIIHILVRFNDADLARAAVPTERANELASWILNRPVLFQAGGSRLLSTNPALDEDDVADWKDRIDAIVGEDQVQLVVYKKDPMASPAPRNLTVWFDAEFRQNPPRRKAP